MASWVLVQVASIVFPEFNAPRWSMRALIIMLIAGFPFAMLLSATLRSRSIRHIRAERRQKAVAWSDRCVLFITSPGPCRDGRLLACAVMHWHFRVKGEDSRA